MSDNTILIALDAETGKEKGRIDLGLESLKIRAEYNDKWFYNTADFSEDGKRLAVAVFSQCLDENGEDKYLEDGIRENRCDYILIDTDSWKILERNYLDGFRSYGNTISYGCVLEPGTYNMFSAQYRSEFGGIVINTMDWENEKYTTSTTTQTIPADDGIFYDEPYSELAVPILASGERIAVCCGNTLYLFDRKTGTVIRGYEYTDAILDAWWSDNQGQTINLLLASGAIVTYDTVGGYEWLEYGPSGVNRAVAFSDGILDRTFFYEDAEPNTDGMVLLTLRENPGLILLTEKHTDDGLAEISGQPESTDISHNSTRFQLSPSGDRLFVFYSILRNGYTVGVYDPVTLEHLQTVVFPEIRGYEPCVMDDEHFIVKNVVFGLDGTEETLIPQNGVSKRVFEFKTGYESRVLSTGQVLTVSEVLAGDTGMTYCWLDGRALEIDPKAGNSVGKMPKSGASGLVVALPQSEGENLTVLDALTGKITPVSNPYPETEDPIISIGAEKKKFAISDGSLITVIDFETSSNIEFDYGYAANEIQSMCFVPEEEYLLILTVSGRLDCWHLSTEKLVYSGEFKIYSSYLVECRKAQDDLFIFLRSSENAPGTWIGIDPKEWTVFATSDSAYGYIPQSGVMAEYKDKRFFFKKVYSLEELEEIARDELGLNNNWGVISPGLSLQDEEQKGSTE